MLRSVAGSCRPSQSAGRVVALDRLVLVVRHSDGIFSRGCVRLGRLGIPGEKCILFLLIKDIRRLQDGGDTEAG
jgi:hypothetical protein